jgi:nucleoside-diphosphate-sugar epimerase
MRVFVAGASGAIGVRLVLLLVAAGHEVAAMTRSPEKADALRALGATPVVCDAFDAEALRQAMVDFGPEAVVSQLTDLPDDAARITEALAGHARVRREGTRNVLAAAEAAGASRVVVQSVAWELSGESGAAVEELERMTLEASGIVIRYGQWYGPGTYFEAELPPPPRVHVDEAARRTLPALDAESGVIVVVD